jgi:hypothetical protein
MYGSLNTSRAVFVVDTTLENSLSLNCKTERVQPITRLFIELAAVELLSDKPNSDQKVLILRFSSATTGKFMIFSLTTFSDGFIQISEEGQPLVLPQDIGSLSPDDVIIIVQGHNTTPIKAKALAYYNFENLKELKQL